VLAAVTLAATMALGAAAIVLGRRRGTRLATALGVLVVVGSLAAVVGAVHVIGLLFGYLVVWAVVLPAAALVAIGLARLPPAWTRWLLVVVGRSAIRLGLILVVVLVSATAVARVVTMPSLSRASDPEVGRLAALVTPYLRPGQSVAIDDARAGAPSDLLFDLERYFGLANLLDREGYHPKVIPIWTVELGPGYLETGHETRMVLLTAWTTASPSDTGYAGRVGDIAVQVLGPGGKRAAPRR
jgi:hypothetical protein